jgi:hypothetical protein
VLPQPDIEVDGDAGPVVCDVKQLVASPQLPDMMVVLDRSSSMEEGGRWRPSVSAVRSITSKLESSVRFGLTLFPGTVGMGGNNFLRRLNCLSGPEPQKCIDALPAASGGGGPLCTPGEVVVPVRAGNASAIATALSQTRPSGGTPTAETLRGLVDSFAAEDTGPDSEMHEKYVLLVTDGSPTCPMGNGADTTQADVDATNAAVEALYSSRVRTYVIGYNTSGTGNEKLSEVLDGFAARGGTGDKKHRPVEDEAGLLGEFQTIATSIASCDFKLDRAPISPDYVFVQLDEQQLNLDAADGFKFVGDRTIRLVGAACDRFRDGAHSLQAEVRCAAVLPS